MRRLALVLSCVLVLGILFAVPAPANHCSGCIDADDIAAGAVRSSEIATNAVGSSEIATNAVGAAEIRIGSVGGAELSFNPATQAELDARSGRLSPRPNVITTVEAGAWQGSITVGSDGLPLIGYGVGDSLKVAHCTNLSCTVMTRATLDTAFGGHISMTLGADGRGLIAYYDAADGLKVAHCSNASCTSATKTGLDPLMEENGGDSITIGPDGRGLIAYSGASGHLWVAHCSDSMCTSVTKTEIDASVYIRSPSIALGADGSAIISYFDDDNADLKVAHCSNATCSTPTLQVVDSPGFTGQTPSIAIGSDGLPLIGYDADAGATRATKIAHCSNALCSAATISTIATPASIGSASVTVGSSGLGLVSFFDDGAVNLARCADLECSTATSLTLADAGGIGPGYPPALTVGVDGSPLVAYVDEASGSLKVVGCGNSLCAPYFRRR